MALELTTKWGTFKYSKPISLTIASTIFLCSVNLINGNLLYLIVYIFTDRKENPPCDTPVYIYIIGLALIFLSLYLFYLLITNWRIEVYSKLYFHLQKAMNTYGTAHRIRMSSTNGARLMPLQVNSYGAYVEAKTFLDENGTSLDPQIEDDAGKLIRLVGEMAYDLDVYIINSNNGSGYQPHITNKFIQDEFGSAIELYNDLKLTIRKKEKLKLF